MTGSHDAIDAIYRAESRRVLATLIRLLGDFDLAEEALSEAFAAAVERWPAEGIPGNPGAWLVSAGRFRAVDRMRRRAKHDEIAARLAAQLDAEPAVTITEDEDIPDDRLRLVFTCCHPALGREAQVALTLREVCGLTTEEVGRAFLAPAPTIAQRIVRAKAKIRDARIPYEIPERPDLPERLDAVLSVVYLVFNEGYLAAAGDQLTRPDLSAEAIRLGRLLVELLPDPEAVGLLALMLLHESRRHARTDESGDLVLLENQDRSRWDQARIAEASALVERALASGHYGPYAIQAAIAAVHAEARHARETDWGQITGLYEVLLRLAPSPVVELNRAVAVAMLRGPADGLALVDAILGRGELVTYHLAHAARAELLRRLGQREEAIVSYERALLLARQQQERRFLESRLAQLRG